MAEDVTVTFGASIEQLVSAVESVKDELGSIADPLVGLQTAFGEIGELAGAAFGVDRVSEFVSSMAELGEQTERTMAILGATSEQVGQLGFVAAATGSDSMGLTNSMERFQLGLAKAGQDASPVAAGLKTLGLSAKEFVGVPIPDQLGKLADAFSKFADGPNKTAIAIALLGRNGAEMIPVLDQGSAGLEKLGVTATATNSVLSEKTTSALADLSTAITTMSFSWKGLKDTAFAPFIDVAQGAVAILTDLFQAISNSIVQGGAWKFALDEVSLALRNVETVASIGIFVFEGLFEGALLAAKDIATAFEGLGSLIAAIFQALIGGAGQFFSQLVGAAIASVSGIGTAFSDLGGVINAGIHGDLAGASSAFAKLQSDAGASLSSIGDHLHASLTGFDFSSAKDGFDAELAGMGSNYTDFTKGVTKDAQTAVSELNKIWGTGEAPGAQSKGALPQAPGLNLGSSSAADDALAAAQKAIQGEIQAYKQAYDQYKVLQDQRVAYGLETQGQETQHLIDHLQDEDGDEQDAYQRWLQLQGLKPQQLQEIQNKMLAAHATFTKAMTALDTQQFTEMRDKISGVLTSITGSFNSQLSGLIQGTTTWSQAWRSMLSDMLVKFLEWCEQLAVKWAANELARLATSTGTEGAITAATAAGTAARTATQAAGAATGQAIERTSSLSTISADAAKAAAGAYAAVSQIPLIGPVLAPAAAAIAYGAVEAFGVFDKGSWQLPADMMALVHQGEMIVPAAHTPWVQSLVSGAAGGGAPGRGGNTHNWNFNGAILDGRTLTRTVRDMMNQDRTLRPAY